jgi:hypothetical protein
MYFVYIIYTMAALYLKISHFTRARGDRDHAQVAQNTAQLVIIKGNTTANYVGKFHTTLTHCQSFVQSYK